MRLPLSERTVSARTAILACILCSFFGGGAAIAGQSAVQFFKPGATQLIMGYGYRCKSTTNRPSFSCYYTLVHTAVATPIMSVGLGQRTMTVQSTLPPAVAHRGGSYRSTFRR
jgi:hypothetical protein